MEMDALLRLLAGRKALLSHYLSAKLRLVVHFAGNHPSERVVIFDEGGLLAKTGLIDSLSSRVLVSSNLSVIPPQDYGLIYLEPSMAPPRLDNRDVLITLAPRSYKFKLPRGFDKLYLRRVEDYVYMLTLGSTMERYRLRITARGVELLERPVGLYGRAYELVRSAIMEYGELSVRDAVGLIARELGVSAEQARRILSKLVSDKYVRVSRGLVAIY